MNKNAFTLAEALITIVIIGVVAAIALQLLIANVNERINSERQANIAQKITQAMEQMRAHGLLNTQYASTDAFVDELQKYLKISKRCDYNHLADCWPTEKVTTSDNEIVEVKNYPSGRNIGLTTSTTNVGLVLADGGAIILNYDNATDGIDVGDEVRAYNLDLPVGFGKSKNFAYSSNVTSAIDFVMDVNGGKKPNSETINDKYHDIRSFKGAKFAKGCASTYIPGLGCIKNIETNYSNGSEHPYTSNNWWAGAKAECVKFGMEMANIDDLRKIYNIKNLYSTLPQSGYYWSITQGVNIFNAKFINFSNGDESEYGAKNGQYGTICISR